MIKGLFCRILVAALFVCAGTLPVHANRVSQDITTPTDMIKFGYSDLRPYAYSENGEAKGLNNELVINVMAVIGRPFTLKEYPIFRMYRLLSRGDIHVWVGIASTRIEDATTISGTTPVGHLRISLFTNKPQSKLSVWQIFDEDVVTIKGFTFSGLRSRLTGNGKGVRFIDVQTHVAAFSMLKAGRATFVLDYKGAAEHALKDLEIAGLTSAVVQDNPLHFIVSKKVPNAEALLLLLESSAVRVWERQRLQSKTK